MHKSVATLLGAMALTAHARRALPRQTPAEPTPAPDAGSDSGEGDAIPLPEFTDPACQSAFDIVLAAPTIPAEFEGFSSEYYETATRTASNEPEECAWLAHVPTSIDPIMKKYLEESDKYGAENKETLDMFEEKCLGGDGDGDGGLEVSPCHDALMAYYDRVDGKTGESGEGECEGSAPGGETPGGEAPGGEAPGDGAPGGEGPGGEGPGGEAPGAETPGGEAPGSETPGGETPGGEAPAPGAEEPDVEIPGGELPDTDVPMEAGASGLAIRAATVLGGVAACVAVYLV